MDDGELESLRDLFSSSDSGLRCTVPAMTSACSECSFCHSQQRIMTDGVWCCDRCNTVADRLLDYGAEWHMYQGEDGRSSDTGRCSTMTSDLICPLGCVLQAGSSCGSTIGVGKRSHASRSGVGAVIMSKHQAWNSLTYRERSLCRVFEMISTRTAVCSIASAIVLEAKHMYKQISHGRIFRGESRMGVIAACVYMALRSSHAPRSVSEVAQMFDLKSRAGMIRGCNLFHNTHPRQMESCRSSDFVARFCCKVGMTEESTNACRIIAERVDDSYVVSDCTPCSVVGAIMNLVNQASDLGLKKEDIADACMVTSGTIARCCRRISVNEAERLLLLPVQKNV